MDAGGTKDEIRTERESFENVRLGGCPVGRGEGRPGKTHADRHRPAGDRAAAGKSGGARGRDPDGRSVRNLCGLSGGADGAGKGREQGRGHRGRNFGGGGDRRGIFAHPDGRRISRHRDYRPFGGRVYGAGRSGAGGEVLRPVPDAA